MLLQLPTPTSKPNHDTWYCPLKLSRVYIAFITFSDMNTPFRLAATATLSCGFLFVIIQQLSCPAPRTNRAAISTKCDAECSLGQLRARLGLTIQPRPWALSDYEPADGATLARWGNTPCWKVAKQTPFDTDGTSLCYWTNALLSYTKWCSLPNSSALTRAKSYLCSFDTCHLFAQFVSFPKCGPYA